MSARPSENDILSGHPERFQGLKLTLLSCSHLNPQVQLKPKTWRETTFHLGHLNPEPSHVYL